VYPAPLLDEAVTGIAVASLENLNNSDGQELDQLEVVRVAGVEVEDLHAQFGGKMCGQGKQRMSPHQALVVEEEAHRCSVRQRSHYFLFSV
jgi:hypothetical protein